MLYALLHSGHQHHMTSRHPRGRPNTDMWCRLSVNTQLLAKVDQLFKVSPFDIFISCVFIRHTRYSLPPSPGTHTYRYGSPSLSAPCVFLYRQRYTKPMARVHTAKSRVIFFQRRLRKVWPRRFANVSISMQQSPPLPLYVCPSLRRCAWRMPYLSSSHSSSKQGTASCRGRAKEPVQCP